jgi:hypothetical protein
LLEDKHPPSSCARGRALLPFFLTGIDQFWEYWPTWTLESLNKWIWDRTKQLLNRSVSSDVNLPNHSDKINLLEELTKKKY